MKSPWVWGWPNVRAMQSNTRVLHVRRMVFVSWSGHPSSVARLLLRSAFLPRSLSVPVPVPLFWRRGSGSWFVCVFVSFVLAPLGGQTIERTIGCVALVAFSNIHWGLIRHEAVVAGLLVALGESGDNY